MFEKELWGSIVRFKPISSYPILPCPYCNARSLAPDRKTFGYREVSVKNLGGLPFDKAGAVSMTDVKNTFEANKFFGVLLGLAKIAELSNYTWAKFNAFFQCSNCHQSVCSVGSAAIPAQQSSGNKEISIKVEYFSPPIRMFELVPTTPESINDELLKAFSHFHSDLTAAGAKLRRAIEQFCRELGYTNGSLHRRIEEMRSAYPKEATWLQSLKLVGNEATHGTGIEEQDLLHSFEVFAVLLDIFRQKQLESKVEKSLVQLDAKFRKP